MIHLEEDEKMNSGRSALCVVVLAPLATVAVAQEPSHRNVNDLNWIEFRELVPAGGWPA